MAIETGMTAPASGAAGDDAEAVRGAPDAQRLRHMSLLSVLRRVHVWAALIASPFAVVAALTGLLYVLTPQIEGVVHGHLDRAPERSQRASLDVIVHAAVQAAPTGWRLHSVVLADEPARSVQVAFMPPMAVGQGGGHGGHGGHGGGHALSGAGAQGSAGAQPTAGAQPAAPMEPSKTSPAKFLRNNFGIPSKALVVYVDPGSGLVLGRLPQSERFSNWAKHLHSQLLIGDGARWAIELAASWMMVLLLTGLIIWWPQPGQPVIPPAGQTGRRWWRSWHAVIGAAAALISVIILSTGLTWSQYAGGQIRWARDATGQTPPRIPASISSESPPPSPSLGSTHVHEPGLAQGPAPNASPVVPLTWDAALHRVRDLAPGVAIQLMPPDPQRGELGVWRANHLDGSNPFKRFDLLLDRVTGKVLYDSRWQDQTAFGKATAVGIPFHRGELGVWNQLLLAAFGISVLWSMLSGWASALQRGKPLLPKVLPGAWRHLPIWVWPVAALMLVAMPVLAASAVVVVLIELALRLRTPTRQL